MTQQKRHRRRGFSILVFALTLAAVFLAAALMIWMGPSVLGGAVAVDQALNDHYFELLLWRASFYGVLILCWIKLGRPVLLSQLSEDRDGGQEARKRLRRLQNWVLAFLVMAELYNLATWLEVL